MYLEQASFGRAWWVMDRMRPTAWFKECLSLSTLIGPIAAT